MKVEYHPTVKKILDILKENNCWFETFEHEPVRTSEEAAKVRTGYTINQGAKAIIVRVKKSENDKSFAMVVIPANTRFDTKKVKAAFNARDVRFATEGGVLQVTGGVLVGGVPPFGNLFNLKIIVDPLLFNNDKIVFNAGDRGFSVAMLSSDYKRLVVPEVIEVI